jgi:hypothetical protein
MVISVNKVPTDSEEWHIYVFYLLPTEDYRGKVLQLKLDSPVNDVVNSGNGEVTDKAFRPFTYYFTPPLNQPEVSKELI